MLLFRPCSVECEIVRRSGGLSPHRRRAHCERSGSEHVRWHDATRGGEEQRQNRWEKAVGRLYGAGAMQFHAGVLIKMAAMPDQPRTVGEDPASSAFRLARESKSRLRLDERKMAKGSARFAASFASPLSRFDCGRRVWDVGIHAYMYVHTVLHVRKSSHDEACGTATALYTRTRALLVDGRRRS
jgi:hypothetical protein